MKFKYFALFTVILLQSCFVHINQDYGDNGRVLAFNNDKKWLINDVYSDLSSTQKDKINQDILTKFQKLTHGNAFSYSDAKKGNLIPGRVPVKPSREDLQAFHDNGQFGYLVNIYTKKVRSDLAPMETGETYIFSKNEAYAVLEVYDLMTMQKIYSQKASAEMSEDKSSNDDFFNSNKAQESAKGPRFYYSAEVLTMKSIKKILKDIEKNAILKN